MTHGTRRARYLQRSLLRWVGLSFAGVLFCSAPLYAQLSVKAPEDSGSAARKNAPEDQLPDEPPSHVAGDGSIAGVVVDATGAAIAGATVKISWDKSARTAEVQTDENGGFVLVNQDAGSFQLTISAPGFAPVTVPGTLTAGQVFTVPQVTLPMAVANTEIQVGLTQTELAQLQLDVEQKQRLVGAFPNFYVSYAAHPLPLSPRQKFTLAGRFLLDPVSFGITAGFTAIEQANNTYPGFGGGPGGYGKRYAAATGTLLDGDLIGNAILPSLLKQDPRYFYKGTGSINSRIWYAIANSVICKGDNGHWQANYSAILGGLAAGGISNFYYPKADRDGLGLTFSNLAIGTAEGAAANIAQEFLFRRLTTHSGKSGKKDQSEQAKTKP